MAETRRVPQTRNTEGEKHFCGEDRCYWKHQKGVPLCFYRVHVQTANEFHSYF
jgi:hypothetical protein